MVGFLELGGTPKSSILEYLRLGVLINNHPFGGNHPFYTGIFHYKSSSHWDIPPWEPPSYLTLSILPRCCAARRFLFFSARRFFFRSRFSFTTCGELEGTPWENHWKGPREDGDSWRFFWGRIQGLPFGNSWRLFWIRLGIDSQNMLELQGDEVFFRKYGDIALRYFRC